jgi:hypothetical protein
MSKTSMVMVYSAINEAEVSRQYQAGTAEAERNGYVPTSEVWDRNTLTVTYQYRGVGTFAGQANGVGATQGGGFGSRLKRRIGLR